MEIWGPSERAVPLEEWARRKGHVREDKGPTAGLEEAPRELTPPSEDRAPAMAARAAGPTLSLTHLGRARRP